MKKLLVSLAAMTIATNVLAESNLVQDKLDTLDKIYHKSGINNPYGHLEKTLRLISKRLSQKLKSTINQKKIPLLFV